MTAPIVKHTTLTKLYKKIISLFVFTVLVTGCSSLVLSLYTESAISQTNSDSKEPNSNCKNVCTYEDLGPKWQKFFTVNRTGVGGIKGGIQGFLNFEKEFGHEEDGLIASIRSNG